LKISGMLALKILQTLLRLSTYIITFAGTLDMYLCCANSEICEN
jgi:hypothetical protein